MLKLLPAHEKKRWPQHLGSVTEAYNNTPHATTGTSPFFLMFGREPRIPIDKLVETPSGVRYKPIDQYVAQHRQKLLLAHLNAYQRTREMIKQNQAQTERNKPVLEKLEFVSILR